jgi:hypothetical protein
MLVLFSKQQQLKAERISYKKTIEELKSDLKEQTEKLMLQNRFVAVSAHEMRNFATKYSSS